MLSSLISLQESPSEVPAALEALPASLRKTASDILDKAPSAAAPDVAAAVPEAAAPNGVRRKGTRPPTLQTSHSRLPESQENSVPNTPTLDGPCLSFSSKKEERLRKVSAAESQQQSRGPMVRRLELAWRGG